MLLERLSWGMALGTEATDYWFHYFGESKAILLRLTLVVLLIDGLLNLVRVFSNSKKHPLAVAELVFATATTSTACALFSLIFVAFVLQDAIEAHAIKELEDRDHPVQIVGLHNNEVALALQIFFCVLDIAINLWYATERITDAWARVRESLKRGVAGESVGLEVALLGVGAVRRPDTLSYFISPGLRILGVILGISLLALMLVAVLEKPDLAPVFEAYEGTVMDVNNTCPAVGHQNYSFWLEEPKKNDLRCCFWHDQGTCCSAAGSICSKKTEWTCGEDNSIKCHQKCAEWDSLRGLLSCGVCSPNAANFVSYHQDTTTVYVSRVCPSFAKELCVCYYEETDANSTHCSSVEDVKKFITEKFESQVEVWDTDGPYCFSAALGARPGEGLLMALTLSLMALMTGAL